MEASTPAYPRVDDARRRTVRAFAQAILAASPFVTHVEAVLAGITGEIEQVPDADVRGLLFFLDLLARPAFVATLIVRAEPFAHLDARDAARALERLSVHPVPPIRAGFQALRRAACYFAYGGFGTADDARRSALGYPGPRADRLARAPSLATARDVLPTVTLADAPRAVDVIVVGSGPGGSVAAAMFAASGRSVLVLEAGEYAPPETLDQREIASHARLYLDRATTLTDDGGVSLLAGATVGGGSVVNWSASLRLAGSVGAHWDEASGLRGLADSLGPHYDAVAARLGVVLPANDEINLQNQIVERGCTALGWRASPIARNASDCGEGCGYCTFGCAYRRKRDMTRTYLRDAVDAGAVIAERASVRRLLLVENGSGSSGSSGARVVGVEAVDRDGRTRTIGAPLVVVAAGALRTPGVLARSGIRARALGRGLHLHPTSLVFAEFEERIDPWHGPPMTRVFKGLQRTSGSFGALVEVAPIHPGLGSVAVPWTSARQHARDASNLASTACLIAIVRDRDAGIAGFDERPRLRYRVSRHDAGNLLEGLAGAARIAHAAGARSIYTAHTPLVRWQRGGRETIDTFADRIRGAGASLGRLGVFSAHQMGTARMHANGGEGVVDERGAVHGVRGVLVTDASVFPAASGVNPMLTILAMARRIASLHA